MRLSDDPRVSFRIHITNVENALAKARDRVRRYPDFIHTHA
jgi:hypothetical protein